jgi:hypothetical protein
MVFSDDENSQTYYFESLTIIVGKIKEMVEKGYFMEGDVRVPGAEREPEPDSEEAVVYGDLFSTGLLMPLHPTLADRFIERPPMRIVQP